MAVNLVGPDGKEYTLPDDARLQEAIDAGFRPAGAEGRTLGEAAKGVLTDVREGAVTAAEGVLRGGTAGLSDSALDAVGYTGATPEAQKFNLAEMKRRKEESPILAGGAELAGMVASPLSKISGGVSTAIGAETALGRIGAGIVGGAVEGSLWGAGNTVSESTLGDSQLTAEKLIAGAGLGALLGGAGGGLGTTLAEGVKGVAPLAAKGLGKLDLGDFANERWLKAAGGIKGDISKIPAQEREAVADVMRQHLGLGNLDDALAAAGKERDEVAKKVLASAGVGDAGGLLPSMDKDAAEAALEKAFKQFAKQKGDVIDAVDFAGVKPDLSAMAKRLDDFEAKLSPLARDAVAGDLKAARKALGEYEGLAPGGTRLFGNAGGDFKALDKFRQDLQSKAKYDNNVGQAFSASSKRELAGIIRDEVDTQLAQHVGPDMAQQFLDAKAALGSLARAEKVLERKSGTASEAIEAILENAQQVVPDAGRMSALGHAGNLLQHGVDRQIGNRWVSASDYLGGLGAAALHGGVGGALLGLPAAIGHKLLRERGSAVIAALADRIAKAPAAMLTAQSFANKVGPVVQGFAEHAPMLTQALAKGPAAALATHLVWAEGSPDYAAKAAAAGFAPETPEQAGAAAGKAQRLVGVAAALKQTDDAIQRGVEKLFKGGTAVRRPDTTSSQDFGSKRMRRADGAHERRMKEVAELAANPEALLDRVSRNLGSMGDAAPGAAAQATAVAHRAVTYLAQQIQRPARPGPLAPEWRFNDTELFVFSKKLETVQDPLSVLEHAAAGTLTNDQVDALKAVYPTVYAQIRDTAVRQLTSAPKSVPYRQRQMLEVLTGVDPDGTFGQSVSKNQAAIAAATQKPSETLGSSGKQGAEMSVAKSYATPQQRREMSSDEA